MKRAGEPLTSHSPPFHPLRMKIAKDGIRSIVKVGYDGRVHKTFRGTDREERFANE